MNMYKNIQDVFVFSTVLIRQNNASNERNRKHLYNHVYNLHRTCISHTYTRLSRTKKSNGEDAADIGLREDRRVGRAGVHMFISRTCA